VRALAWSAASVAQGAARKTPTTDKTGTRKNEQQIDIDLKPALLSCDGRL